MKKVLLLCSLVVFLWFGWDMFGRSASDNVVNEIGVSPGQTLVLDLDTGGDLEIRGWNRNSVAVDADISNNQDCCVFEMKKISGGVRIHTGPKHPTQIQTYTGFRFQIDVPENFNIDLNSAGGEVKILRVNGRIKGVTGGGEILIRDSKGEAHLSTGGGNIHVIDSHMDGDVTTGRGEIRFDGVTGSIEGSTGSGTVIRNERKGKAKYEQLSTTKHSAAKIDKSGGAIQIDEAPNGIEASTGGGDIRIGSAKQKADVLTGGGDIRIDSVDGEVQATTGGGDVIVNLLANDDSVSHDVDISSGRGDITVTVPPSFPMQLDLKVGYTNERDGNDIISDFPLQKTYTKKWSEAEGTARKYIYGKGSIGSGKNRIRISTVNGNIYLKKSK